MLRVGPISVEAFALQFLAKQRQRHSYLQSLDALVAKEGHNLAITETSYGLDQHHVQLFDIKVKQRFEDEVMERIYGEWGAQSVCPLRRGMCVGLINHEALVLAVGNIKMFYSDSDSELVAGSKALLCEKANGEYTMLSSARVEGGAQWLVFGSKNVRLTLPFDGSNPLRTLSWMNTLYAQLELSEPRRFSYLKEMIPLWLHAVERSPRLLRELELGTTLLGEQVGVHAHIYTGYARPHIRLFASLPHAELTTTRGCDLEALRGKQLGMEMVEYEAFDLPRQQSECAARLAQISSGSMQTHGEGVVVYVYDQASRLQALFKHKCEEYAFDRKLRTLLSPLASDLSQAPVTKLRLREEAARVAKSLSGAGFDRMDQTRKQQRLELVPALVGFLDRHQATQYCHQFSDRFVSVVAAAEARRGEYLGFAHEHFMQVEDAFLGEFDRFLSAYKDIHVECAPVEALAAFVVREWQQRGGLAAFQMVGIAASVGSGKTAVLREVERQLGQLGLRAVLCDRDEYSITDNCPPHVAHVRWTARIAELVLERQSLVLVGNTFGGGVAAQLEKQTGGKVLLFAFPASPVFALECLRRLARRRERFADGSTLTMQLGSSVVLEKFFSNHQQLEQSARNGSTLCLPSPVLTELPPAQSKALGQELAKLHKAVLALGRGSKRTKTSGPSPVPADDKGGAFKPKVPRACALVELGSPVSPEQVMYTSLLPRDEDCRVLHALCDVELVRTDAHLTLKFAPKEQDLQTALAASGSSGNCVRLRVTGKYTVTESEGGAVLQFVTVEPLTEEDGQALERLSPFSDAQQLHLLHITLGCSDFDKLPSLTSKLVLELGARDGSVTLGSGQVLAVRHQPIADVLHVEARLVLFCGK